MPTRDRPALLAVALDSVVQQTIVDWECIVVDDGSASRTRIPVSDARIRLIRLEEAAGPARARNIGVQASMGGSLCFLDDDDVWLPHRLELAAKGLALAPVTVCWGQWFRSEESGQAVPEPLPVGHVRGFYGRELSGDVADVILDRTTPHLDGTAIDREAWLPFDESYLASQDVEWWLRISRASTVATIRAVGFRNRRHDGDRTLNGPLARYQSAVRLMTAERAYFRDHPKARAFRLRKMGRNARSVGANGTARLAFLRSLAARPSVGAAKDLLQAPLASTLDWRQLIRERATLRRVVSGTAPDESPLVSIGVPVYNGEAHLAEALDSILSQTYRNIEVIVCDNASTDATPEIIETYAQKDDRLRSYRSPVNRGAAANYNWAFRLARGQFFKWAPCDDQIAPGFVEECLRAFRDGPSTLAVAYPRTIVIDGEGSPFGELQGELELLQTSAEDRLQSFATLWRMANPVLGLIRSSALELTGLIRPYRSSDIVCLAELALRGQIVEVPAFLHYRRIHDGSATWGPMSHRDLAEWTSGAPAQVPRLPHRTRLLVGATGAVLAAPQLSRRDRVRAARALCIAWTRRGAQRSVRRFPRRLGRITGMAYGARAGKDPDVPWQPLDRSGERSSAVPRSATSRPRRVDAAADRSGR